MNKQYYIYILTNINNNVFYVGVTNNLVKRIWKHKHQTIEGFTKKYNLNKLIYYETFKDAKEAIKREKYIKGKRRSYKLNLIEKVNLGYEDLYDKIV